jgi:hypothetical protein
MNKSDIKLFLERVVTKQFVRRLALSGVVASGLFAILCSSASSPDYKSLWWTTLPWVLLHLYIALRYIILVKGRSRWLALFVAMVAILSYWELATRAWP